MNENIPEEGSIGDYYDNYKQTQAELIVVYSRKTKNAIFAIAGIWLASELLGLVMANVFTTEVLLSISIVPAILIAAGFFALKQPLAAIIVAAVVFAGVWILTILVVGGIGAISGLLIKAVIIYFLIVGFQNAREANRIKKEIA
jgi:hypothetical protein